MKKNIVPHIILSFFLNILFLNAQASEIEWKYAKEGNKVILIRHSIAPGSGDPKGFDLDDCKTQRNLNKQGINQSKELASYSRKIRFQ